MPRTYVGKRTVSLINGAGKTDYLDKKNGTRPLPLTNYKNQLKMD
jgi:hypothetical protein